MTIITMHRVDEVKLAKVMEETAVIGSVTINVYFDGETAYALEGVHRTEAAKRLGLPLILNCCQWEDIVPTDCEDVADRDGNATVGEIHEYAYSQHNSGLGVYDASDFEEVVMNK